MKKLSLIKLFHTMLQNSDVETAMVGIDAIMCDRWVTWSTHTAIVKAAKSHMEAERIRANFVGGRDYFISEVTNLSFYTTHYIPFENLINRCMNFEHMQQKQRINQAIAGGPY